MNKILTVLCIFFISTNFIWGTQQIETVVFPSEDEIVEALSLGEISIEQFFILTELITNRVEPSSFLLEQIPQSLLQFDTQNRQNKYFINKKQNNNSRVIQKNRYSSYLDENASTRYQSSLDYKTNQFHLNLIVKKEFSGRKRFTRRYISFTSGDKQSKIIVGNFTKRFGLGGIVGYRGKLFSFSDELEHESFLFPDYGSFNGAYTETIFNNNSIKTISSLQRDNEFSVFTNALMFNYTNKSIPTIVLGIHRLKNRKTGNKFDDFKTSLYKKMKYQYGFISSELVAEFNKQSNSSAILIEGKHKTKQLNITYALWNYGKSFLNISGGSKTSLISEYVEIENVQYDMLSKRSNQTGGLLKSKIQIATDWQINISSLYAFKNSDTTEMQLFCQLAKKFNTATKLSVDFLFRNKVRAESQNDSPQKKYQTRVLLAFRHGSFFTRNYFKLLQKTNDPSYLGYFSEVKHKSENYGVVHFWLNFSRLNIASKQLDYFYGFIKNEIPIYNALYISFKLSHRYNRSATVKQVNQFSIDMSWQI